MKFAHSKTSLIFEDVSFFVHHYSLSEATAPQQHFFIETLLWPSSPSNGMYNYIQIFVHVKVS